MERTKLTESIWSDGQCSLSLDKEVNGRFPGSHAAVEVSASIVDRLVGVAHIIDLFRTNWLWVWIAVAPDRGIIARVLAFLKEAGAVVVTERAFGRKNNARTISSFVQSHRGAPKIFLAQIINLGVFGVAPPQFEVRVGARNAQL